MPATIVLNQSNLVQNGKNNALVYNFPNSVQFPHHEIAVQQISMYYSWQNINTVPLGNNTFTVIWNAVPTIYTIPDGLYEIADINRFLQFSFIQQGKFLINPAGQNVYYAEMLVNPTLYAVQLNTFPWPTGAGWTLAGNTWTGDVGTAYEGWTSPSTVADPVTGQSAFIGFTGAVFNPGFVIGNNFNKIVGFTSPVPYTTPTNTGANFSATSNVAPQVQPNSSAYLAISNINNPYASPSSILYSINPNVGFGEQISITVPEFAYNRLLSGTYNELRVQILGIDYQPLTILDPNMTIILVIRDLKEMAGIDDMFRK
jgi:hypothetical protein